MTKQRVITIGIQMFPTEDRDMIMQMEELSRLVDTAGGEVVKSFIQKRHDRVNKTLIGEGKIEEVKEAIKIEEADLVIFYDPLTPSQNRNLNESLEIPVIDRIQLILDIFALHVSGREGKLQVELAQKEYLLPRIGGKGSWMSRLGGGIGTRGPGESKLEQDRRVLQKEISKIKHELNDLGQRRQLTQKRRQRQRIFQIGLIGYTNAGKSTLMNLLSDAQTKEEDALFATLTTLTRKLYLSPHFAVTLSDTVGFIQDLPPVLIDAFHSTLEESRNADFFLIVVDESSPYAIEQETTVKEVLRQLQMDDKPYLVIYNKKDQVQEGEKPRILYSKPFIEISARNPEDREKVKEAILNQIKKIYVPFLLSVSAKELEKLLWQSDNLLIEQTDYDESQNQYRLVGYQPEWWRWH